MLYMNSLEAELNRLERELRVAELNNWEFDIEILKDELKKYIKDDNVDKRKISSSDIYILVDNELRKIEKNIIALNEKSGLEEIGNEKNRLIKKMNSINSITSVLKEYEKNCILNITIDLSISSFNVSVFRVIARRPLISLRGSSTFFYYYGFISYIYVSYFALTQVVYVMYD